MVGDGRIGKGIGGLGQRDEILFLFNHDAPHQVAHVAGIVRALVEIRPDHPVTCAVGTRAIREHLEALLGADIAPRVGWLDIGLPRAIEALLGFLNRLAPVKRLLRLDLHASRLRRAAILVSTERTCLRIRKSHARGGTRFVHVPHGSGDRAVTYHRGKAGFSAFLVAGEKAKRELIRNGVARAQQVHVVGYPKFDTIDLSARPRLFANGNPTFLYNPHFDPYLSSWYDHGPALLDWFASEDGQRCNLIFAPHIMLFRKKIHVSPEYRLARARPDIAPRWQQAGNILIDTNSRKLVDMTYTLAADGYIGDVSSQVYEFMIHPRPIFFIDRFSGDPRSREGRYPAWSTGDVVTSVPQLLPLLAQVADPQAHYLERQRELLQATFSHDPARPASLRAAEALLGML